MSSNAIPSLKINDNQWQWLLSFPDWAKDHPRFFEVLALFEGQIIDNRGLLIAKILSTLQQWDYQDAQKKGPPPK